MDQCFDVGDFGRLLNAASTDRLVARIVVAAQKDVIVEQRRRKSCESVRRETGGGVRFVARRVVTQACEGAASIAFLDAILCTAATNGPTSRRSDQVDRLDDSRVRVAG